MYALKFVKCLEVNDLIKPHPLVSPEVKIEKPFPNTLVLTSGTKASIYYTKEDTIQEVNREKLGNADYIRFWHHPGWGNMIVTINYTPGYLNFVLYEAKSYEEMVSFKISCEVKFVHRIKIHFALQYVVIWSIEQPVRIFYIRGSSSWGLGCVPEYVAMIECTLMDKVIEGDGWIGIGPEKNEDGYQHFFIIKKNGKEFTVHEEEISRLSSQSYVHHIQSNHPDKHYMRYITYAEDRVLVHDKDFKEELILDVVKKNYLPIAIMNNHLICHSGERSLEMCKMDEHQRYPTTQTITFKKYEVASGNMLVGNDLWITVNRSSDEMHTNRGHTMYYTKLVHFQRIYLAKTLEILKFLILASRCEDSPFYEMPYDIAKYIAKLYKDSKYESLGREIFLDELLDPPYKKRKYCEDSQ